MYYNNHPYLSNLQGHGLALNKSLRAQKLQLVSLAVCGTAIIYLALQRQKQKAFLTQIQLKPTPEE